MLLLSQVALSLNLPVYVPLQLLRAGGQRFFIMTVDQGRAGCSCDGNRPSRVLMSTFDLTRERLETTIRTADNTSIEPGVRTTPSISKRREEALYTAGRLTSAVPYILVRAGTVEDRAREWRAGDYPNRHDGISHPDPQADICEASHVLERWDNG